MLRLFFLVGGEQRAVSSLHGSGLPALNPVSNDKLTFLITQMLVADMQIVATRNAKAICLQQRTATHEVR
jgi:hypothetical protein